MGTKPKQHYYHVRRPFIAWLQLFVIRNLATLTLSVTLCLVPLLVILSLSRATTPITSKQKCWLKDAFERGDFVIYSHRSFFYDNDRPQPSCTDALSQLKQIGVNHLDLDLVFDKSTDTIVVSHPMEFKRESMYYSPCSLMPLDNLIEVLDEVYNGSWFISLEPKASWGRTAKEQSDPALVEPIQIMEKLLKIFVTHDLDKSKCAVIIDVNTVNGSEELNIFQKLLNHSQLFVGKRNSDEVADTMDASGFRYDKIMPTIEFHHNHPRNQGMYVPKQINPQSIFWVIDNEEDLRFAADLQPHGIVTNSPKDIVKIINDPNWCST